MSDKIDMNRKAVDVDKNSETWKKYERDLKNWLEARDEFQKKYPYKEFTPRPQEPGTMTQREYEYFHSSRHIDTDPVSSADLSSG